MKKYIILASLILLAASCGKEATSTVTTSPTPTPMQTPTVTPTPSVSPTPTPPYSMNQLSIKYTNTTYGFVFSLPADWNNFSVAFGQWQGNPISQNGQYSNQDKDIVNGPEIIIRNPKWSVQNPTEDIPIMVFTPSEWTKIQNETLAVSAAPFPPSELGSNKNYVFALPPRYDYDYRTGYQEVENIMASHPLVAN